MRLAKRMFQELFSVLIDRDLIILLLAGPIALTVIFGGVYLNNYINDIPVAVFDEDNSSLSRMVVNQFREHERFSIKYEVSTRQELQDVISKRKAYLGLYIPSNFSKDAVTGKSTEAVVLIDGSNIVMGNNSLAAATSIIQTVSAGISIKIMEGNGIAPSTANDMAKAFTFNERVVYDPRMTYLNYMLFGFIAVFLQQVMLSGVGISVIKRSEHIASGKTFLKLIARISSCAFFAFISTSAAIATAIYFFKVPLRGSLLSAFLMSALFAAAISCPAIIIASLVRDKLKMAQVSFMLSLPTFVSCGYVWPQDQMPQNLVLGMKMFWPLAFFARNFDELLMKGLDISCFKQDIIGMLLYIAFWLPVGFIVYKFRFRKDAQSKALVKCEA